jgi:hypothetical protein
MVATGIRVGPIVTVTAAAETFDLTTLARMKRELGLTDNTKNTLLTDLIKECSAVISRYCGRTFAVETVQERWFPFRDAEPRVITKGPDIVQLRRWPIVAITSVVEDGTTLVEETDFIVDAERGQLIRIDSSGYPTGWPTSTIVIIYSSGYSLIDELPREIERACIEFTRLKWFATKRDPLLKQESIPEVYSATYAVTESGDSELPASIAGLVDRFRVPVTGAA